MKPLAISLVCPNALWVSKTFLSYMPQRGIARLAYRCVLLCGKPTTPGAIPTTWLQPHFLIRYTSKGKWNCSVTGNQSSPSIFFCMAHLVITVVKMLTALSCNLAKFHISWNENLKSPICAKKIAYNSFIISVRCLSWFLTHIRPTCLWWLSVVWYSDSIHISAHIKLVLLQIWLRN